MKFVSFIAATAVALALGTGCVFNVNSNSGKVVRCKGPVVDKMMDFKDFEKIVINGSSDIKVLQGEDFLVTVHANEEVFDHLNYRVENGVLMLETIDKVNIVAEEFDITVALPQLTHFTVNGAADADMNGYTSSEDLAVLVNGAGEIAFGTVAVPNLSVTVNGAGDIDLTNIEVESLKVDVHGAGDVTVSGKAHQAQFNVSGVGDIDATGLDCDDVHTAKSGVASIRTKKS